MIQIMDYTKILKNKEPYYGQRTDITKIIKRYKIEFSKNHGCISLLQKSWLYQPPPKIMAVSASSTIIAVSASSKNHGYISR
jgi:hypothetical protein